MTKKIKEEEIKEEEIKEEVDKKYFVKDSADRFFKKERDGFDLNLKAGIEVEITAEIVELIKEKFPYLDISER